MEHYADLVQSIPKMLEDFQRRNAIAKQKGGEVAQLKNLVRALPEYKCVMWGKGLRPCWVVAGAGRLFCLCCGASTFVVLAVATFEVLAVAPCL